MGLQILSFKVSFHAMKALRRTGSAAPTHS